MRRAAWPPVRRRNASSSAASAAASAGMCQTGWPASFSSRKSVRAAEPHHLHVLLDHGDERQEQRAVEAVLVELVGRHVRGRDHHHAELEQTREQAAENHRIGDIGDVEFVEAQQPALFGDRRRRRAGSDPRRRSRRPSALAKHPHALVHVGHEFVEMRAPLARPPAASKNRSISMVLPRPTSPWM